MKFTFTSSSNNLNKLKIFLGERFMVAKRGFMHIEKFIEIVNQV